MRRRAGMPGEQLGRRATEPPFPQRYAHSSQALKNSGGRSCPGCGRRRARARKLTRVGLLREYRGRRVCRKRVLSRTPTVGAQRKRRGRKKEEKKKNTRPP